RHLEYAAAAERTQFIDEPAVVLRAPIEAGIHETTVEADITLGPILEGVDLAVDQAADGGLNRRHLAELLAHRRHLVGAGGMGNAAAQPEQEPHLRPVAHV